MLPSGGLPWRRDCCYGDRYQTTPSASIGGNSPDSFLLSSSHFLTAIQLLPPTDWIKIMTRFSSFGFLLVKCEEWRENGEWGCCGGVSWLFTPTAIYTEKTSQNGFSKNAFFSLLFSLSLLFLPLWNFQWLEFYESQECRVGKISTARVEGIIIIINNNNNNNNNKNDDEYLASNGGHKIQLRTNLKQKKNHQRHQLVTVKEMRGWFAWLNGTRTQSGG